MSISLETGLKPSDDVVFRKLKGESVLLDMAGEFYYGLDEVGTRIWQLIDDRESLSGVLETMLDEYDVDRETLKADVERIAGELLEKGLVVKVGG